MHDEIIKSWRTNNCNKLIIPPNNTIPRLVMIKTLLLINLQLQL